MKRKFIKMHILFPETASCISIHLVSSKVENWRFGKTIHTNYKTDSKCHLQFETKTGEVITYCDYVPDFFPARHYGDFIRLSISDDGTVNMKVSDKEIEDLLSLNAQIDEIQKRFLANYLPNYSPNL